MTTLDKILKSIDGVPANRLEELNRYINSLIPSESKSLPNKKALRVKILSYAGAFSDMDSKDYDELMAQIKEDRKQLFTLIA